MRNNFAGSGSKSSKKIVNKVGSKNIINASGSKSSKKIINRSESKSSNKIINKSQSKKSINKSGSKSSKKIINKSGSKVMIIKKAKSIEEIEWRSIPGHPKYDASSDGQIKNVYTNKIRKQQISNGYYTVNLHGNGKSDAYNDDPKNKIQVNHIDKNRSNNYYKNLEWTTPQENTAHALGKMVKMLDPDTNKVLKIFRTVKGCRSIFGCSRNK